MTPKTTKKPKYWRVSIQVLDGLARRVKGSLGANRGGKGRGEDLQGEYRAGFCAALEGVLRLLEKMKRRAAKELPDWKEYRRQWNREHPESIRRAQAAYAERKRISFLRAGKGSVRGNGK
jgi:hypothetical protein